MKWVCLILSGISLLLRYNDKIYIILGLKTHTQYQTDPTVKILLIKQ